MFWFRAYSMVCCLMWNAHACPGGLNCRLKGRGRKWDVPQGSWSSRLQRPSGTVRLKRNTELQPGRFCILEPKLQWHEGYNCPRKSKKKVHFSISCIIFYYLWLTVCMSCRKTNCPTGDINKVEVKKKIK